MMATTRWREVRLRIACASAVSVDVIAFSVYVHHARQRLGDHGQLRLASAAGLSRWQKNSSFCGWPSRRAAHASERNDEARALAYRPGVAHRAAVFVHQVAHH